MIKIVGIEFIPRLGNGRPENGTGTFVEALMYPALSSPRFWTDDSLHQWPRLFVADHLDNIPRFIEHLDFSAPVTGALSCVAERRIARVFAAVNGTHALDVEDFPGGSFPRARVA
jgi:hypothetical protein